MSSACRSWQRSSLKYVHLNPGIYFVDLLACRAVVIAGGTMSPVDEFVQQLLSATPVPPPVTRFSCGHIIPPENLCVLALGKGPQGHALNFSFGNRSDEQVRRPLHLCTLTLLQMLHELGRVICNLSQVVDDGLIVFFPSYAFEELVHADWTKRGVIAAIEV